MLIAIVMAAIFCFLGVGPAPARAESTGASTTRLSIIQHDINDLIHLDRLLDMMAHEAVSELLLSLGEGMGPDDSAVLRINLQRIYAPERLSRLMSAALSAELAAQDPQVIDMALRFYDSPPGRRLVGLELSARRVLLDPDQMQVADEMLSQAQERGDPRLDQIERLIAATDVVETGVVSGLNGSIQSTRGFYAAIGERPDPQELTVDATLIEDRLRPEISQWVRRMLLLAYQPLDDAEIEALIVFVATPEARILSACLNRAFDAVFMRLSFEVGIISGAALSGEGI
ncbi:DUF2059 domain-containing protein [Paracoccus sp. DMF-8]|uniref:DUF2059 domain-containing protein n=1 Tax=Paracoccus sp. DMF-8 TaxID=3019445 RepID=UPI0023E7701E|nr:DUF2059 domain-containing protein [Paracoccus sp. DMF-8]MDF3605303.1 DUF2059 domain-containing protein [Paracoccus sp. DMF-8]